MEYSAGGIIISETAPERTNRYFWIKPLPDGTREWYRFTNDNDWQLITTEPVAQGPQGDPGPAGEQGEQGPAGDVSACWPIGSVFLSVVDTNPNTLLGFGTWSQIAGGKFLVGQTVGDADFDTGEETGGAKTHTHAGHDNHVFTQPGDHAAHTHAVGTLVNSTVTGSRKGGNSGAATLTDSHGHTITGNTDNPSAALAHSGGAVDAHSAHDSPEHLPPYLVVYVWKRTA